MGLFKDDIFFIKSSPRFRTLGNHILLLLDEVFERVQVGLHSVLRLTDDIVDSVQFVELRPHIRLISQYMVLPTNLTKDQLMDLAEHVDFVLVEGTNVHEVMLHVHACQLADVLNGR